MTSPLAKKSGTAVTLNTSNTSFSYFLDYRNAGILSNFSRKNQLSGWELYLITVKAQNH